MSPWIGLRLQHKLSFVFLNSFSMNPFHSVKAKWGHIQERSSAAQIILQLSFSQTPPLIINDLKHVKSELQENTFVNLA